jgi:hypothetical protein
MRTRIFHRKETDTQNLLAEQRKEKPTVQVDGTEMKFRFDRSNKAQQSNTRQPDPAFGGSFIYG